MSIRVNGKVIASNGDVKTETDNLVTTDTNQTITATKVFTAEQQKKSTVIDITTQPENYTSNNAFRFIDKNDQISGYIENGQMASGEITTGIHAKNKDGYQPRVSVFAPLTGMTGAYAIAPITPEDAPIDAITTKGYVDSKTGGLELLDITFAPLGIDESKNKRRYLNGQVIIQSQFPAFTAAVKARMSTMANAFTTETNWQAEKTNSKLGQCGKFVVDDTAGTIRLPCVVNAQGLVDLALIGEIKSESLPNIKGTTQPSNTIGFRDDPIQSGAFYLDKTTELANYPQPSSEYKGYPLKFDTSRSSSTYQDNAPVQQEAIQYPYCIVVNTSVEEADRPINNYQVNNVYSYGMSQYYKGTMNNNSWLKSAGQWNDGTVYTGMYNWLLEQVNKGVDDFITTNFRQYDAEAYSVWTNDAPPTIGMFIYGYDFSQSGGYIGRFTVTAVSDNSITFMDTISNIEKTCTYSKTVASSFWDTAFVINTADRTFRLPLLNGQEGIFADGVKGNGISIGLSNKDGTNLAMGGQSAATDNGYSYHMATQLAKYGSPVGTSMGGFAASAANSTFGLTTDPTKSGMVVDKTVPSGWNLYYYIGDTLQNAQLINVARIEEKLTDVNAASRGYVIESYRNGTDWYRIYSDGWIEQGGSIAFSSSTHKATFNFIKPFSTIPTVFTGIISNPTGDAYTGNKEPTTSSVTVFAGRWLDDGRIAAAPAYGSKVSVYACGY